MISIIIPSYNQQEYLADAIESALDQNCKKEIIVVDDGSTDNSLAIALQYEKKFPGVRVIAQVNKGLASARNTGIMNATHEYILPLDADDILLRECGKTLLEHIGRNDVLAGSFQCFGVSNNEVILMKKPTLEDFQTGNRIGYSSLIKKSALLEVGGYSPKMVHGYEDLHLWFNLLTRGKKISTLQQILWLYRTKEQSMIHTAQAHHEELMAQINADFHLW